MKPHSFDPLVAKEIGIECAILLYNIEFWIEKNKANNRHFYEGKYWTYNSTKAFAEQFPYMSERVIYKTLQKLIEKGYIIKGNFNKNSFDRTCWYALGEKFESKIENTTGENANYQMEESILPNGKIENTTGENDINVSDINTDKNHFENTDKKSDASKEKSSIDLKAVRESFERVRDLYKEVKPAKSDLIFQRAEQEFFRVIRSGIIDCLGIEKAMIQQKELWEIRLREQKTSLEYIPRLENWLEKKDFLQDFDSLLAPLKKSQAIMQRGLSNWGSNDDDGEFF